MDLSADGDVVGLPGWLLGETEEGFVEEKSGSLVGEYDGDFAEVSVVTLEKVLGYVLEEEHFFCEVMRL